MFNSSRAANQNQSAGNVRSRNGYNVGTAKTNGHWPQQVRTQSYGDSSSQSLIQSNRYDSKKFDSLASDINQWQTLNGNSNIVSSTDSIVSQAVPKSFAAPEGWHSEVLESSSPIPNQSQTNLNINNTDIVENNVDFVPASPYDSDQIIFSNNESNRIVNEIPSSTILPSTTISRNSVGEQNLGETHYFSSSQPEQVIVTEDQQAQPVRIENRQLPPVVVHKTLPNNTVTYNQNISVRYLQPPTPPPPGPIIIREVIPPAPPAPSPVQIRQRPPPPCTPPPIVIREKPPPPPPHLPPKVIEKYLPPPPRPPRRMIVERFAPGPPKPADVIIERWLPYKRTDRRKILFERVPGPFIPPREPNMLILHDQPHARVHREFINQGVTRADPVSYLQYYGADIDSWRHNAQYAHIVDEASRSLPPPAVSYPSYNGPPYYSSSYPSSAVSSVWDRMRSSSPVYPSYPPSSVSTVWDRMRSASPIYPSYPSSSVSNTWDRMRSASAGPYMTSYAHDYSPYSSSYPYSTSYPGTHVSYNDYGTYRGDFQSISDASPVWGRNSQPSPFRSHIPTYQFSSSSPAYPERTIRVESDQHLQNVLSDLTSGRVPSPLRSY